MECFFDLILAHRVGILILGETMAGGQKVLGILEVFVFERSDELLSSGFK